MADKQIIPPRVPLTDPRTGLISREWYHFLLGQATLTGGSALTKTNDSNVTLSLGGSPSSALLAPVSMTLGWTGQLPIARGGTGADTADEALTNLGAAPVVHGHSMDDVTGLTAVLTGKAAVDHNHEGIYQPVGSYAAAIHTHDQADVTGLEAALDGKVAASLLGVASGVATLDSGGKIPSAQLPAIAITDTFPVASQTAMLALTAEKGDVAVRLDLNKSFILTTNDPTTLGNWQELLTPTDAVQSVNGYSGTVTLYTDDVDEAVGATNLWFTDARARAAMTQARIEELLTGDISSHSHSAYALSGHDHTGVYQPAGSYAAATHGHAIADVTGLQTALDGKQAAGSYAAASHAHAVADVTGLQTALDGKSATTHNHDGTYAAASHGHAIADVTGLQTALDGKSDISHTHSYLPLAGGTITTAPDAVGLTLANNASGNSPRLRFQRGTGSEHDWELYVAGGVFTFAGGASGTSASLTDLLTIASTGAVTAASFNSITGLSSANGAALGTAAAGTSTTVARADHVHPTTGLAILANTNTWTAGVQKIQNPASGWWEVDNATAQPAFVGRVSGGANANLVVYNDGKIEWGSGGASARDTSLYRLEANVLATDDALASIRSAVGDAIFTGRVSGDTSVRFAVYADGKHEWGPGGSAARDTNLYRSAANTLATDDAFRAVQGFYSYSGAGGGSSTSNRYAPIAILSVTSQYGYSTGTFVIAQAGGDGHNTNARHAVVQARLKQQNAMASAPYVELRVLSSYGWAETDIVFVLTSNTASLTEGTLYVREGNNFDNIIATLLNPSGTVPVLCSSTTSPTNSLATTLPAGTQTNATMAWYFNGADIDFRGSGGIKMGGNTVIDSTCKFTGSLDTTVTATTQATSDNSSKVATTEFVKNQGYTTSTGTLTESGSASMTGGWGFTDVSRYWLYTATNWGIYWNTTDNRVEFHGGGTVRSYIDLDDGAISAASLAASSATLSTLQAYNSVNLQSNILAASGFPAILSSPLLLTGTTWSGAAVTTHEFKAQTVTSSTGSPSWTATAYLSWKYNSTEIATLSSAGAMTAASFNGITGLSSSAGSAIGTAASGSSTDVARADHVHSISKTAVENVLTGAITSHTHSYLPLAGGTLSGTLNGTTGSFSQLVFSSSIGGVPSTSASAGTPTVDSPSLILRGRYWSGAASTDYDLSLVHDVTNNSGPLSRLSIRFGGVEKAYIQNDGLLLTKSTFWAGYQTNDHKIIGYWAAGTSSATRASYALIGSYNSGDSQPVFAIDGNGTQRWGVGGSTSPDLDWYRDATTTAKLRTSQFITEDSKPIARVYATSSQTLTAFSEFGIWVDGGDYGTGSGATQFDHANVTTGGTGSYLEIPITGYYRINAQIYCSNSASNGSRKLMLKKGSSTATAQASFSTQLAVAEEHVTAGSNYQTVALSWMGPLTAGDRILLVGISFPNSPTTVTGQYNGTFLEIEFVGRTF